MPKQNNKINKSKKIASTHVFRGCREAFLTPAPGQAPGTSIFTVSTGASGTGNFAQVLCPLGLTSTTLGASAYAAGTVGNVTGPPLRGLWNKCSDFQWYRVTRARFVFVGNVGTTSSGTICLAAYADPLDVAVQTKPAFVSSGSTRMFSFASVGTKEVSVPVPVDSSWKKVSAVLTTVGNAYPFTAATPGSLVVANTVGDISFGAVQATWGGFSLNGSSTAVDLGTFYLDYDLELKGPIDSAINI